MEYRNWILQYLKIGHEFLYLSEEDCKATGISVDEVIELDREAMIAYSKKDAEMPAKIGLHPQPDSLMHAMPAYIPGKMACGIKWGSNFPTNNQRFPDITPTNCQILYNDPESGLLLSMMDATWITEIRTPGVSIVSIKYLANLDAASFGMFGCGIQGRAHTKMIEKVLTKLEKIYVYDVRDAAVERLIKECSPSVSAKIVKAASPEELVKNCEVIASAVPIAHKPAPFVKDAWVSAGQTLVCCDCHSVYEDAVYKRADKYYLDSVEQHELLVGYGYYPWGLPKITGETGEVFCGAKPGRVNKDELIVANNVGMAVEDMMCARAVFDAALKKGIGLKLPMWGRTGQ
jgi:ornithine cyclodeaminase/alanine dehydrogenase